MKNENANQCTGKKKQILFVDDEENVLTGLKRIVRSMRDEWDASFAMSAQEALQIMDQQTIDVLVTDMRMPMMDGAQLLSEVSSEYPHVIRILLSGQCDLESFIGTACPAHQLLSKPCDAVTLKRTIERVIALRYLLENETLRDIIMQMNTLPSPPTIYLQIEKELERADSSMQRVGEIIGQDTGMTAKLLQLVNSPFFGFNRNIDTPAQAAALLGVNMVQFIMLHVQTFVSQPAIERTVGEISEHCMLVATLARAIAKKEGGNAACCLDAYIGGMMHDLGRLILAVNMPEKYKTMNELTKQTSEPAWKIEQQEVGASHAEIGAYLLGLWGLPEHIVEIVHYHHAPGACKLGDYFPLTAVHVANVLIADPELEHRGMQNSLDEAYLDKLALTDHIPDWQECLKELMEKSL